MYQKSLVEISKINPEYETKIPEKIREFLNIKSGDSLTFEIKNGEVIIKKTKSLDYEYLATVSETLNEWLSPEDEEAYSDL